MWTHRVLQGLRQQHIGVWNLCYASCRHAQDISCKRWFFRWTVVSDMHGQGDVNSLLTMWPCFLLWRVCFEIGQLSNVQEMGTFYAKNPVAKWPGCFWEGKVAHLTTTSTYNAVVIVHTEAMIMDIRKFKQTGTETSVNKSTFLIDLLEEHEPCRLKLHHNKKFKWKSTQIQMHKVCVLSWMSRLYLVC